jgi:hypothetical protein
MLFFGANLVSPNHFINLGWSVILAEWSFYLDSDEEGGLKLKSPAVAGLTELRTEYLINYVL